MVLCPLTKAIINRKQGLDRAFCLCGKGEMCYNGLMRAKYAVMIALICMLAACKDTGERRVQEPQTPDEMYARVQELLRPNAEHDASDFSQAMEWLRRAAEGGHRQAQTDLGGIYLEGGKGGIEADGKESFRWFEKAAAQGSQESLYYMGLILYTGKDVPEDKQRALKLWQKAASGGVAEAQLRLGVELARSADITAVKYGVRLLTMAVEQAAVSPATAAQAACALGNFYTADRPGFPRNLQEAARWYQFAADGGAASAQLVYALMLLQGEALAKDTAQGMRYLKLAAGQDHVAAIQLLIKLLRSDESDAEAEQEAKAWEQRLDALLKRAAR